MLQFMRSHYTEVTGWEVMKWKNLQLCIKVARDWKCVRFLHKNYWSPWTLQEWMNELRGRKMGVEHSSMQPSRRLHKESRSKASAADVMYGRKDVAKAHMTKLHLRWIYRMLQVIHEQQKIFRCDICRGGPGLSMIIWSKDANKECPWNVFIWAL